MRPGAFALSLLLACEPEKSDGEVDLGGDCAPTAGGCDDDQPVAAEVCDGVDNDGDGSTDEGVTSTYFRDLDGDGYGKPSEPVVACAQPAGFVPDATDCNDLSSAAHPGAAEPCDGRDNDCDGIADDEPETNVWLRDADADTFGDPSTTYTGCPGPDGYLQDDGDASDCDDGDASRYPGASEICDDGVLQDCEGTEEEALAECAWDTEESLSVASWKLVAEGAWDWLGVAVSGAGDVDGDGLDDVLIGAMREHGAGRHAGAAYLLRGGGALRTGGSPLDVSEADQKFLGEAEYDYSGLDVSGAGDVDGDGLDDVLVGAYGEETGGVDAGAAYLLLGGGAVGADASTMSLAGADLKLVGESGDDNVGVALSGAGDMDGDGLEDCLVGAPGALDGEDAGAAYLLLGGGALNTSASVLALSEADVKLTGETLDDGAGRGVSGAGDVDGDGLNDMLVSAPYEDSGGADAGAVYLLLGGGAPDTFASPFDLSGADTKLIGAEPDDQAGGSISGGGDIDGDGLDDVLVGAIRVEGTGYDTDGAAYLLLGGGALSGDPGAQDISRSDVTITHRMDGSDIGRSVAIVGDVDGDDLDDILVSVNKEYGSVNGAVYLLLGGGALGMLPPELDNSEADLKLVGEDSYFPGGYSSSGAGDVDGDGRQEFLVGAYREDSSASDAGAAYLFAFSPARSF